jgi:DNA-binding response OmpR family regulator
MTRKKEVLAMFFSRRPKSAKPSCITRLLVVEDDPLVAFDHELDLKGAGYTMVATVNSGEAAVAVLAEADVDAVVLDLHIAGSISGEDVARLAFDRGIAVMVVSGDEPGAAAEHAYGHLSKPLGHGVLVAALRAMEQQLCKGKAPRVVNGLTIFASSVAPL